MENNKYGELENVTKVTNQNNITCAKFGDQRAYLAHAISNDSIKFRVLQNRKGHLNKHNLTYILFYKKDEIMVRVDISGAVHDKIKTPHIHIFDETHNNGKNAIPISKIKGYTGSDEVVKSFSEFLNYCNFSIEEMVIQEALV